MLQVLSPGVEHAEKTNFGAEVLGSSRDFQQGRGTGVEEQAVEEALVLIGERGQSVREGEDHMHVTDGE